MHPDARLAHPLSIKQVQSINTPSSSASSDCFRLVHSPGFFTTLASEPTKALVSSTFHLEHEKLKLIYKMSAGVGGGEQTGRGDVAAYAGVRQR